MRLRKAGEPISGPFPSGATPPLTLLQASTWARDPATCGIWKTSVATEEWKSPAPRGPIWCQEIPTSTGVDLSPERGA